MTGPQYAALEAQRLAVPLEFVWTPVQEYSTLPLQASTPEEEDPEYTNQVNWYVNATTGHDANPGTAAAPLQHVAEFTRRVKHAKYGSGFGPYVLTCLTDIPAATDSFQWSPLIESIPGTIGTDPDTGFTVPILRIIGTKTTIGTGVVGVFTAPFGSNKCLLTRTVGVFAPGDIIEFTSGAAAGKRVYILEVTGGGLTGQVNPALFNPFAPVYPAPGDTFNHVQLTKWGPQIMGVGMPQAQIDMEDCWIPTASNGGCGRYELMTIILRFCGCLLNVVIQPGLSARVKFGKFNNMPTGMILPSLDFLTPERGEIVSLSTSFYNTIIDVFAFKGMVEAVWDEVQFGCYRNGASGEALQDSSAGFAFVCGCRIFDVPTVVPANAYIGSGGTGDAGAAVIGKRGAKMIIANNFAQPCVSNSSNVGTVGVDAAEGAIVRVVGGAPVNMTGNLQDIRMDAGKIIPFIDPLTGVPLPGQALTSWADWANIGKFSGDAHNLKNGTCIVTAGAV
jgi:hypothetical protein